MKARNVILAVVALAVLSQAVLAMTVTITPKHLSLRDDNKPWVRCYVALPDGYEADDVSAENCVLEEQIVATKVREYDPDGNMGADVIVFFDRDAVREMLADAGAKGNVELTLKITMPDGVVLSGTGTIKVTK